MLDDPLTLRSAAEDVGLDADTFEGWLADDAVEQALRDDVQAARTPSHAAAALAHKLASWEGRPALHLPVLRDLPRRRPVPVDRGPGFQPEAASEVAIANLAPELERGETATDVEAVLRWAGEPLATAEVAAVCGLDRDEARQQLSRVATERPLGQDGLWTVAA